MVNDTQDKSKMVTSERFDLKKATRKERKFLKKLLRHPELNPSAIALEVYDCKNKNVANGIAYKNIRKFGITMEELMDRAGLGVEQDIADLERLSTAQKTIFFQNEGEVTDERTVDDLGIQKGALELRLRLKGKLNSGNGNGNGKQGVQIGTVNVQVNDIKIDKDRPVGNIIREFTSRLSEGHTR